MQQSTEVAELLLKAGANADCIDFEGMTAAHIAARDGMIEAVRSFIVSQNSNKSLLEKF